MTVQHVYDRYRIMPNLQQHMLRVAGVADFICERLEQNSRVVVERENVVKACLLHDLGNIVKFDLEYFPAFLEPEGLEYWQQVKAETKEKYGGNAHFATIAIVRQLEVPERVIELIDAISFNRAQDNCESTDWSAKVCAYSDMRVAPQGVVSMQERLDDGFRRYEKRGATQDFSRAMGNYLRQIEQQLCEDGKFEPNEITDISIAHFVHESVRFSL